MARKTSAAKAAEVKEEVTAVVEAVAEAPTEEAAPKKTASKRTASKKTAEKKPTEKKTAEKKTTTRKTTAKAEMQVNLFIQYQGSELSYADLIERAKAEAGVKSPKSVNLYVKPEENMVYFVVDDNEGGFVLA